MAKRLKIDKIVTGNKLACVQYYEVTVVPDNKDKATSYFRLKNEEGEESSVTGSLLEQEYFSAEQYTETRKVTQTEIIHRLMTAGDTVFTATFKKQMKPADIKRILTKATTSDLTDSKRCAQLAKRVSEGEVRKLRGYLVRCEPDFARSLVVDLDVKADPDKIIARDRATPMQKEISPGKKEATDEKTTKKRKRNDVAASDTADDATDETDADKKSYDPRWRQIDHRTLEELIIKNIRYCVK